MSIVRVAFLGTPEFAKHHLKALIDDEHFEVVGVVSQPDRPAGRKMKVTPSPVKVLAQEHNLPVITPQSCRTEDVLREIAGWKAEAAVVVAFGQILPQIFLNMFPNKVVNVHGSLLPRWRGAAPIQRSLMEGDKSTGVCLQVMVEKLDAGPILGTRKISLEATTMDALELHDQMMELGAELLRIEFMDYLRGNLAAHPQNEDQVTYAKKIEKSEGEIDWSLSAQVIMNRLRGLKMGPGSYTLRGGKKLKIHQVLVCDENSGVVGQLSQPGPGSVRVQCGQGGLELKVVQPESKGKMEISAYLAGHPIQDGEVLGE